MDSAYSMEREFEFTAQHFNKVRNDLYDYAGIVLADHKQDMAYNRLVRRLRALKLENFEQYFNYIQENPKEFQQFINALTTNLSAFFRERHHFDFIADDVLPEMRQGGTRKLRIWSAGCSHGEEAYSLAMTIVDNLPELEQYDVKILATDIDSAVLDRAKRGVYDTESVNKMDKQCLRRHFLKGVGTRGGQVQVRREVQKLIHFKYLNLMNEWPMQGDFDAIFCRNVMIYFNRDTQQRLLDKMADLIRPGGYLFVGHSEALARYNTRFKLIGKTIYQKDS